MRSFWQVQEAKNRFSELIETAVSEGPQIVTHHGKPIVRVVAIAPNERPGMQPADGFVSHLLNAPRVRSLQTPKRASRRARVDLGAE